MSQAFRQEIGCLTLDTESVVRFSAFFGVLVVMAIWEAAAPRRERQIPRLLRWTNNFGVAAINALLVRLIFPGALIALAQLAQARGWGALNSFEAPVWCEFFVAMLALDLTIYLQHWAFHRAPPLWRLHRMHHADLEFDVSTGLRFHPLEILLSVGVKAAAIIVLGPPAAAVLAFEVLLNAASLFNHGNVRIPRRLDRLLRLAIVTPDMHRVHHSVHADEMNSNFGFNLPWWDRAFGTYRAQPRDGHATMAIGLKSFRSPRQLWLHRMLVQPFLSDRHPPTRAREP